jgi:hypothetical protein
MLWHGFPLDLCNYVIILRTYIYFKKWMSIKDVNLIRYLSSYYYNIRTLDLRKIVMPPNYF